MNPIETALLGILINHEEAWKDIMPTGLEKTDFSDKKISLIFECMDCMNENGDRIDYLTVGAKMEKVGVLDDIGGSDFLLSLHDEMATVTHAVTYASEIKRASSLRKIKKDSEEVLKKVGECDEIAELSKKISVLAFEAEKIDASSRMESGIDFHDAVREYMEELDEGEIPRMSTGFDGINVLLGGGFAKGDYIILGGRSGMGKSALAIDIVKKSCLGKNVLFFSFEMSRKKIIKRFSQTGHGDLGLFRNDKTGIRGRFFDNEDSDSDIDTIEKNILYWCCREKVDLVVLDHFHIINVGAGGKSFYEAKTALSGRLQRLARKTQVPFLVLSQLNREAEGKPPQINHLRDSGAIEQDADCIMLLHGARKVTTEPHQLHVVKNRDGETGKVMLDFDRDRQTFKEALMPGGF